tara:strand:+ start:1362 stop:1607 length:246 start_codon:yes stop_codon:yes gene_type:complete
MVGTPEIQYESKVDSPALSSTPIDLAQLGLNQVAYIRRAVIDQTPVWSIHNAAGNQVGAARTREQAVSAIMQNDLTPLHVN